jgi:hypothetical protein
LDFVDFVSKDFGDIFLASRAVLVCSHVGIDAFLVAEMMLLACHLDYWSWVRYTESFVAN